VPFLSSYKQRTIKAIYPILVTVCGMEGLLWAWAGGRAVRCQGDGWMESWEGSDPRWRGDLWGVWLRRASGGNASRHIWTHRHERGAANWLLIAVVNDDKACFCLGAFTSRSEGYGPPAWVLVTCSGSLLVPRSSTWRLCASCCSSQLQLRAKQQPNIPAPTCLPALPSSCSAHPSVHSRAAGGHLAPMGYHTALNSLIERTETKGYFWFDQSQ